MNHTPKIESEQQHGVRGSPTAYGAKRLSVTSTGWGRSFRSIQRE